MINRAPSARSRTWNPGLARWKLPPKTLPFRGGNGSCWKNGFSRETNKKGRCSEIRDSKLRSIDFLRESSRERKISDFGFGVWTFLSSWKLRMQNIFFFLFFFFQSGRRSRWIVIVTVQFATRLWQCETLEELRRLFLKFQSVTRAISIRSCKKNTKTGGKHSVDRNLKRFSNHFPREEVKHFGVLICRRLWKCDSVKTWMKSEIEKSRMSEERSNFLPLRIIIIVSFDE